MPRTTTIRVEFTKEHDTFLAKYLAVYCPVEAGRRGRKVFELLVENKDRLWPWSVHHTWQSWRDRYVRNADHFDAMIMKYQAKHNIKSAEMRKRAADSTPIDMPSQDAKRVRLEAEEEEEVAGPSNGARTEQAVAAQQSSKPASKSTPTKQSHEPDVLPSPPTSTIIDLTKEPTHDPTNHEMIKTPSQKSRPAKHLKKKSRAPSEVFASEPSTPNGQLCPPSLTQPGLPPSTCSDFAPISTSLSPRAPPRMVDSFHGPVLVDEKGHVPRVLPQNEAEQEEPEDKSQRSPPRTAKEQKASGPDVQADTYHESSRLQPAMALQENTAIGGPDNVFQEPVATQSDAVVAQSTGELHHDVASQVESRKEVVRNGASLVKCIVLPAQDSLPGLVLEPSSKPVKFLAPRASTASPFRPEPQPRPQSRTKSARHPALARIRRETTENRRRNVRERGRRREHGQVPSLDLVALSHSSTSPQPGSCSSTGASVPVRPPRWSLPAVTSVIPWVSGGPHGASLAPGSGLDSSGSGSGGSPFRWASPAHGDLARRLSAPLFPFIVSPSHSVPAVAESSTSLHAEAFPAALPLSVTPHPPDLPLTASHGLASILGHMSVNHGLALGVVETVYKRVGSLREADEVLKGMREAAEGFGETEIKRRKREKGGRRRGGRAGREVKGKEAVLKYVVVTSEDGEGSQYSPPETSRAAMWKRQTEMENHVWEVGEEDDEAEGRAVEEELREGIDEDDDQLLVAHYEPSRHTPTVEEANSEDGAEPKTAKDVKDEWTVEKALSEPILAQELERMIGKGQLHNVVVKRFV